MYPLSSQASKPASSSKRVPSLLLFMVFLGFFAINSCSEKDFTKDAAASFALAKAPYEDGDWDIAIKKLGEFKTRFPYSQYAVEAELLIANANFEMEKYEEAAAAYGTFVKLHPRHKELGFAMYRAGECYWQLAPSGFDREQEFTHRAIEEWEKLLERMPKSTEANNARTKIQEGKLRIARSYELVAKFYCKQDLFHACAFRSINLARLYPEFTDIRKEALARAADALVKLADGKREDPKSDKNVYYNTLSADEILALSKKLRREASSSAVEKKK